MTTESLENHYDVIVIGAGLGGLTAAAWLAKAGKKVLLVEKEPRVGGYFGPVVHGSYFFNNGPRLLMGCNADGPYGPGVIHNLLVQLGVRQQCEFIPLQPFMSLRMPDLDVKLWSGRQAFFEGLNSASPGGFEKLPELLELCGRIHQAGLAYYQSRTSWERVKAGGQLAIALLYQNSTLESVLRRYLPQDRPRSLLASLWAFLGLPPWRASFIYWAVLMATYIDEGAFFCKGGLHQLPQAIAGAFQRDGGECLLNKPVARLLLASRKVRGVELADGRQCFAPMVIANIDPRQVFGKLLEPEQRPQGFLRKLGQMETAIQGLNLSLVTDLDLPGLGFGYETLLVDNWDTRQTWQTLEADLASVFSLTVMNAADPGMAQPGQHLVNIFRSLPTDFVASPANIKRSTIELLSAVKRHVPGLMDHLVLGQGSEGSDGYLTSLYDPIYGWSTSPRHAILRRLGPHTPLHGLILAGQWTRPGQGAMGVIFSGLQAAEEILK